MKCILKGLAVAAVAVTCLSAGANKAGASYVLTSSGLSPTSFTAGQTTFSFSPSVLPAPSNAPSNFSVIDLTVASTAPTTAPNSGTVTLSENFSISDGVSTVETFTLTGTFTLVSGSTGGVISTYAGTITNIVGSGYTVSYSGYSPAGLGQVGHISIQVSPVVPEPAGIALLGVGGVLGLAARFRSLRRKAQA